MYSVGRMSFLSAITILHVCCGEKVQKYAGPFPFLFFLARTAHLSVRINEGAVPKCVLSFVQFTVGLSFQLKVGFRVMTLLPPFPPANKSHKKTEPDSMLSPFLKMYSICDTPKPNCPLIKIEIFINTHHIFLFLYLKHAHLFSKQRDIIDIEDTFTQSL